MDTRTQKNKKDNKRDLGITGSQNKNARKDPAKKNQKVLTLGESFIKTVLHFWPKLQERLGQIHDSRYSPFVVYKKEFLFWWGLLLFVFKLSSKRQLDYDLRDLDTFVLENINRLVRTDQETSPVHKTLSHFLEHVGSKNVFKILIYLIRRLIRMKALDGCRMDGAFVIAIDGTGYLFFKKKHCDKCIVHKHENQTYYFHPVLEAKIVDSRGFALSVGSEFVENDSDTFEEYTKKKQDCELKAFKRLAPILKSNFPQTPICIAGDSLYACGSTIQICNENNWHYVLTLKKGGLPSVWKDVQGLLKLCPENTLSLELPDKIVQDYRWINDVSYLDSQKRMHTFDVIICKETNRKETKTYAWITDYHITSKNVVRIATQGGRVRSKIENQGFNIQKNSGLNLEHAYSFDPDVLKSFYCLLQIAHIILQMIEKGSLLKNIAKQFGKSVIGLFGSLKNIARRLLECFRNYFIPDEAFDRLKASQIQIRLDSS